MTYGNILQSVIECGYGNILHRLIRHTLHNTHFLVCFMRYL